MSCPETQQAKTEIAGFKHSGADVICTFYLLTGQARVTKLRNQVLRVMFNRSQSIPNIIKCHSTPLPLTCLAKEIAAKVTQGKPPKRQWWDPVGGIQHLTMFQG